MTYVVEDYPLNYWLKDHDNIVCSAHRTGWACRHCGAVVHVWAGSRWVGLGDHSCLAVLVKKVVTTVGTRVTNETGA
jgi:hypothetical protein